MGKKKVKGEYNDFLDGEKLRDNADVRTTLQDTSTLGHDVSPQIRQERKGKGHTTNKSVSKRPQLTHFLCLPLVDEASRPQLQTAIDNLKEELRSSGLVPVKAVRPLGTLHLTLGVMSLDASQLKQAQQYLDKIDLRQLLPDGHSSDSAEKNAGGGTVRENNTIDALSSTNHLRITLEALVPMQKPMQTSILYAEPRDASGRLLSFGKALRSRFEQEGLMVEDKRDIRLHATIINTIYAKPKGKSAKSRGGDEGERHGGNRKALNAMPTPRSVNVPHDDNDTSAKSLNNGEDSITSSTSTGGDYAPQTKTDNVFDGGDGHGPNAKSWMRFDARDLMDKYAEYTWANDIPINRVQICKMGAAKILDEEGEIIDEQYEVVAEKFI